MKKVKFEIDLSEWRLLAVEGLGEAIMEATTKATTEALNYAFEGRNSDIYFPITWGSSDGIGDTQVDDPLTVYLCVGLESMGEKPTFKFNLRECLKNTMEECEENGSSSVGLEKLMYALRVLADEIAAVLLKSIK